MYLILYIFNDTIKLVTFIETKYKLPLFFFESDNYVKL